MPHQPKLVPCKLHGSSFCYIQLDGSHLPDISCKCAEDKANSGYYSSNCPIDLHRQISRNRPARKSDLDSTG